MGNYEFDAIILKPENVNGAFVEFPYDVEQEFGTKGQVKVKAAFDGHEYRGSLVKMGRPRHILGMTQTIREAIGKQPGDTVHVSLARDEEPRVVEVPEDLRARLAADREAQSRFSTLSYTNQKEYVQWITGAKKQETRENRLKEAIRLLADGVKRPR